MNNRKNKEDKALTKTFSMRKEVFEMLEKQAKERFMTNSGYVQSLILEKEFKKNDR